MKDSEKLLLGGGVLGLALLIFMKRKEIGEVGASALDVVNDELFKLVIPSEARPYAEIIKQASSDEGVDPFITVAIGYRESHWGTLLNPPGPAGTGDNGHGRGLMQIDDRTWGEWLAEYDWTDPYTNVQKGLQIYNQNLAYFEGKGLEGDAAIQAALAAYNHGPGNVWKNLQAGLSPDVGTTGGNYAGDVWSKAQSWAGSFLAQLGSRSGEEPV